MQQSSRGLLSLLTEYEDRIDQQRASGLTLIGFVLFLLSLGWLALALISVATAPEAQMAGMADYAITYAMPVLSLAIWWSARRGFWFGSSDVCRVVRSLRTDRDGRQSVV